MAEENIKTVVTVVIAEWNVDSKVHTFVHNKAKNMTNGQHDIHEKLALTEVELKESFKQLHRLTERQ